MRRYIALHIVLVAACALVACTMTDGQQAETLRFLRIELQDSLRPGQLDYNSVKWRPASSNGKLVEVADVPSNRVDDFLAGEGLRGSCKFFKKKVEKSGKVRRGWTARVGGGSLPCAASRLGRLGRAHHRTSPHPQGEGLPLHPSLYFAESPLHVAGSLAL